MKLAITACVIVLVLVLSLPTFLSAQASSGLAGVVTDSSGAVVAGAEVKLTNSATAFSASTTTNGAGGYQFLHVPPGEGYTLTVSKTQFRTVTIEQLSLGVSVTETRNATLVVGSTGETIEVTASGEGTVNTVDASIGNVLTPQQVQDLPSLIVGDATALLVLQPGVQSGAVGDSQFGSVTGSRADAGTVTLDGLDVNDERIGVPFFAVGRAPIDSVSEVRTIVGGADASFGRSGGAQVDLVTKTGTNHYHGDLYEYNRVSAEAANDFFNNFSGLPRAQLTRNQFGGSVGGPILKDKLFFFFDYAGRRDAVGLQNTLTVPLDPFRAGQLSYVNQNNQLATIPATGTPGTITTQNGQRVFTPGSLTVQGFDPQGIGADQAFLSYLASRPYPEPNDFALGDGINTAGFLFNAPSYVRQNTYVGRIDYTLSSRHSLFARGTWDRDNNTQVTKAFPNDAGPVLFNFSHERSWVVGDTWTINSRMFNSASFGLTRQVDDFPFNPKSAANAPIPNLYGFDVISGPFGDPRGQSSNVPVPEIRDTFSWSKGRHNLQFGADIKPIRVHSSNTNDVSFPALGLNGAITTLNTSLRPADISGNFLSQWDNAFTTILGRYTSNTAQYNYDVAGNPVAQFSPAIRDFHYNEYEIFAQDSFKVRSDLTLTYGLRWNYHSVPFEANGFESVANIFEQQMFSTRQQNAANGVNGFAASPFVAYNLGGPKNHGPNYYNSDWKDFAPRVGIAYSPSFTEGILGRLLGDRKTSIRAGAGMAYDRVLSTLSFEIDEASEIFATSATQNFGTTNDPVDSLLINPPAGFIGSPRFTSISAPPPQPGPGIGPGSPTIPRPFTPFVTTSNGSNCPIGGLINAVNGILGAGGASFVPAGQPCGIGLQTLQTLFQLNNNLKTPYNITASFGFQRELPKNFLLEVTYFGKLGRRLLGTGDPAQQLNFVDSGAGHQSLNAAYGNIQGELCGSSGPRQPCNLGNLNLAAVTPQSWFENQVQGAINTVSPSINCPTVGQFLLPFPVANCTTLAANLFPISFATGDVSTVVSNLANAGLLLPNSGLPYQTGSIANVGNFAASDYHSLIVTVRKKFSDNLYFDFDYAYAHGIDNVSDITNDAVFSNFNGQGLICDLRNLRACRGDADFDARHTISANYEYQLPIGRGQRMLGSIPKWANEVIGGWGTSGIVSFHTGYPFPTVTNAFPINFTQLGPAVFLGPSSAVKEHVHVVTNQNTGTPALELFANQQNAVSAFGYPFGGGTGDRNTLHGPRYSNFDMALLKDFKITEGSSLQFKAEAFNVFNHASFNNPNVNANAIGSILFNNVNIQNPNQYGLITSTANSPRQLSLGLILRF
ncbi:MAG TPA: TonB-dependent receptor [Terriglobales bacterium]|nr:TonB-dependent receptor [Terriglobales bacterium]